MIKYEKLVDIIIFQTIKDSSETSIYNNFQLIEEKEPSSEMLPDLWIFDFKKRKNKRERGRNWRLFHFSTELIDHEGYKD